MSHNPTDLHICVKCIEDDDLQKLLKGEGQTRRCDYCRKRRRAVSMDRLAELIAAPFRDSYQIGEIEQGRNGPYERGDGLSQVLQEELGIDCDPLNISWNC